MNSDPSLLNHLEAQLPAALELLRQMVGINSYTANPQGVNELARLTARSFEPLGFKADSVPSANPAYGDHLVLTRPGTSGKRIGLITHLDTVFPPEEEERNNFHWRPAGDQIHGPGTMDIKGGTVMIHLVLSALQSLHPDEFNAVTWVVLANSSEEVLSDDFGRLCLERLGKEALAALVFEPGARTGDAFAVVTSRKGRAVFKLTVEGCGAHAGGDHHRGANAVVQIGRTIQDIAALTDYDNDLTFNVGSVSGGTVVNRVPHEATAEIEMRAFRDEVYQRGRAAILALNGKGSVRSAVEGHTCQVKVEVLYESPPWPTNERTEQLYQTWRQAGRDIGLTVVREQRGGLSDANFIWHQIPTLDGLGPRGDNAHCSEQTNDGSKESEYVEVSSFVPKAALNVMAMLELIKRT
jgi:glutamate carboxypeptidase